MLLPHNNEVTKPWGLNTFLDGLAELGIDKGLIKNKKLLSDLIEKEKGYRNAENTSENESNNEGSSSHIENQEEEVASRMVLQLKAPKRATMTLRTTDRKQKVVTLKRRPPFTLKVPVNIAWTLMCTGHWSWNVLNGFGTISTRFVLYAITRFPKGEITVTHNNAKTVETKFYSPSKEENEENEDDM